MSACIDAVFVSPPRIFAVENDAKEIDHREAIIDEEMLNAVLSGAKLRSSLSALATVFVECSVPDWDGYGAKPANVSSLAYAFKFLKHLPPEFPEPDISVDPDGEIALEWHQSPRSVFSVSVSPLGELTYAGLYSGLFGRRNKTHGVETPVADAIPVSILEDIQRVYR